ncbi:MAG: hypothetical protein JWO23_599 [Solirubrobacterales bacterium]|jgi:hypothetical protein|nr:hypothetical protein [Solirubrobacterales bacterium]
MSVQVAIIVIVLADLALIGLATFFMSRAKLLTSYGSVADDEKPRRATTGLASLTDARTPDARGPARQSVKVGA